MNQDLGDNLSAVSPRESHQPEETLPTQPLGQFQAHRSDSTMEIALLILGIITPYQSEIFSDNNTITKIISNNISSSRTTTPSKREMFSETGTGSSSSKDITHSDRVMSEEATDPMRSESSNKVANNILLLPGLQQPPPQVKYFL